MGAIVGTVRWYAVKDWGTTMRVEEEAGFSLAGLVSMVVFFPVVVVGQLLSCLVWAIASQMGFNPLEQD